MSRHLPLRMRRLRTARPSFVLLRAMKPWRRRRRRFLGWYVRFGKRASSGPKKKWYLVVRPLPHGHANYMAAPSAWSTRNHPVLPGPAMWYAKVGALSRLAVAVMATPQPEDFPAQIPRNRVSRLIDLLLVQSYTCANLTALNNQAPCQPRSRDVIP